MSDDRARLGLLKDFQPGLGRLADPFMIRHEPGVRGIIHVIHKSSSYFTGFKHFPIYILYFSFVIEKMLEASCRMIVRILTCNSAIFLTIIQQLASNIFSMTNE